MVLNGPNQMSECKGLVQITWAEGLSPVFIDKVPGLADKLPRVPYILYVPLLDALAKGDTRETKESLCNSRLQSSLYA